MDPFSGFVVLHSTPFINRPTEPSFFPLPGKLNEGREKFPLITPPNIRTRIDLPASSVLLTFSAPATHI